MVTPRHFFISIFERVGVWDRIAVKVSENRPLVKGGVLNVSGRGFGIRSCTHVKRTSQVRFRMASLRKQDGGHWVRSEASEHIHRSDSTEPMGRLSRPWVDPCDQIYGGSYMNFTKPLMFVQYLSRRFCSSLLNFY